MPGVWAVGDVIDTAQLAHIGFAEGMLAITDMLGEDTVPVAYDKVPWCIYCHPEVAFAGHSEESASDAGYDVVGLQAPVHGQRAGHDRRRDRRSGQDHRREAGRTGPAGILGVHMVGPWVTEQLGQGYLAVNWEATVDEVAQFIQPHPTMSELFGESVLA